MKPIGMKQESYKRYQNDGFTEEEIANIWEMTLVTREQMKLRIGKESREITSSTYKRVEKRLNQEINRRMGIKERKWVNGRTQNVCKDNNW